MVPDASWTAPAPLCAHDVPLPLSGLITGDSGGTWSGTGVSNGAFIPAELVGANNITRMVELNGCVDAVSNDIIVKPLPIALAGADTAVCALELRLEAQATQGIGTWSGPANILFAAPGDPHTTAGTTLAGNFTLVWTVNQEGCIASDEMNIIFHSPADALVVNAGSDQLIEVVTSATISATSSQGAEVTWSVLSGTSTITDPTLHSTTVTGLTLGSNLIMATVHLGECTGTSDTLRITVEDLFIPQGFSPNGDGDNDRFVVTGMMAYPGSAFTVFNRWGQPVYENGDYTNDWDGTSNGAPLPDDTYFYVLNLEGDRTYNGFVVIKR